MDLDTELAALNASGALAPPSLAKAALDKALGSINGRSILPASEVADWLLDIRQALGAG